MSDQETIDALNQRTAAYDVQVDELNQQILTLQGQLDLAAELQTQVTTLTISLAAMTTSRDAEKSRADLMEQRWNAQNAYVVTLEAQNKDALAEVTTAYQKAVLDAQIAAMTKQRNDLGS